MAPNSNYAYSSAPQTEEDMYGVVKRSQPNIQSELDKEHSHRYLTQHFESPCRKDGRWQWGCLFVAITTAVVIAYSAGLRNGKDATSALERHSGLLPTISLATPATPPRAFVCITGQLPRLELRNKINNLLIPFSQAYEVEVDVALVLSDTNNRSVRRKGDRQQKYFSVGEVAEEISAVPGVTVLNHNLDIQSKDPIINEKYLKQRSEHGSKMTPERRIEEIKNHVRQFESLAKCHYQMARSGRTYDIVHRVREDTGYYQPLNYTKLHKLTSEEPMTIVTTDCTRHGGINDRGAFVSPESAYDYFNHPLIHMYTQLLPENVRNTEGFLMATYQRTCNVKVSGEFNLFRIWDGPNGKPIYMGEDLDCIEKKGLDQGQ